MSIEQPLEAFAVTGQLLDAWQSAAVIAIRSGVSVQEVKRVLDAEVSAGRAMTRRSRLDGHNPVWMYRRARTVTVLGRKVTVSSGGVEEC